MKDSTREYVTVLQNSRNFYIVKLSYNGVSGVFIFIGSLL